jgi:2-oxoglutarate dehydrogenase E1 component
VRGEAIAEAYDAFEKGTTQTPMTHAAISNQTIQESMRLILLVRSFQVLQRFKRTVLL